VFSGVVAAPAQNFPPNATFPTLVPNNGVVAMSVADVPGVKLSGPKLKTE
jgi:hypothetical protein